MTNAYTQERKAFGGHLFDLGAIRQRMAMNQAQGRCRSCVDVSRGLDARRRPGQCEGDVGREGLGLRGRESGHVRLCPVPRRDGLHARVVRSNACTATPASCRSAVAPPKSCSKRSPSAPTAEGCHTGARASDDDPPHPRTSALPHRSHHRTGWCCLRRRPRRRSRRRRVRGCRTAEQDRLRRTSPRRNSASTRTARTGVYAEATIARSTRYRILAVARSLRSAAALSHRRETAATTRLTTVRQPSSQIVGPEPGDSRHEPGNLGIVETDVLIRPEVRSCPETRTREATVRVARRCSRRAMPSAGVGRCPSGTHHMTCTGSASTSNHSRARRRRNST